MIEEKVDFRKQTDLKTKELEVHTSIYTSPNTKIVDNKSEGPQQPQQQPCITNASFSPNDDEDCDAMNIPCENAAVQPLCEIQRDALDSLSLKIQVRFQNNYIHKNDEDDEGVVQEADINFELDPIQI